MSVLVLRAERLAVSFRVSVRALVVLALLILVAAAVSALGLMVGRSSSGTLSPAELVDVLMGRGSDLATFAVVEIRAPRVLASLMVGFVLGASGAIFQSIARNGLVSPDIIGVNSGASVGALVVIVLGTTAGGAQSLEVPLSMIAPAALVGAFGAAIAVYVLGYRRGVSPYRLVLIGIGVTAVLDAIIDYCLTLTRFPYATELAFRWTIGNLYGTDWSEVGPGLIAFGVLAVLAILVVPPLVALGLGDETAVGLGARVERDRLRLVTVGVVLAALAVALAGPVGFVAFIAPHIARALMMVSGPLLVFGAGFVGAALTQLADFIAQHAVADVELPLGAITALIGAPYFLYLLYRTNRLGDGG